MNWNDFIEMITPLLDISYRFLTNEAYLTVQAFVILYVFTYNTINFALLLYAFIGVRDHLKSHHVIDWEVLYNSPFAPTITILVPAYNEAVTIAESLRSLTKLRYPQYEIIVTNDGSQDKTMDILKSEFDLIRKDADYLEILKTNTVKGVYQSRCKFPKNLKRLIVLDKENGGKADSSNAGINAAKGEFVCTIDADSMLDEDALLQVIQPIVEHPEDVIASGGQVAIANGCKVNNGQVEEIGLPKKWIPMFQVVEYIRSFTGGRTAFERLNCLLVLSGAFSILNRKILLEIGGFLTKRSNSTIIKEYCGSRDTVGEDMEVIVRMWRYTLDQKQKKRIAFFPHPICWTEAPEKMRDLGKQRNRWFRGLCEILTMHRTMLFNPKYRTVGLFSMPFQFLFECLGPIFEFIGYLFLPLLWLFGLLSSKYVLFFFITATVYGVFLSAIAVLLGLWNEQDPNQNKNVISLFRYTSIIEKTKLFIFATISSVGYRQIILFHQMKGLMDFIRGKSGWMKFERTGFQKAE